MNRIPIVVSLLAVLLLLPAPDAHAGGGPETTLVVVNSASPVSRIVAAEYVRLHDIPPMNVVHLDGLPAAGVVSLDFFLEKIWGPVAAHMAKQGITYSIDLVTYSADFPYGVDFRKRLGGQKPGNLIGGTASLTGATYLIRHVLAGDPFWAVPVQLGQPAINRYFRLDLAGGASRIRAPTTEERKLYQTALAELQAGRLKEAAQAWTQLAATWKAPSVLYNQACALALLGRSDGALDALEEAIALGYHDAGHTSQDKDLASLRDLPRFHELLESMQTVAIPYLPTRGFRSTYVWNASGEPDPNEIGDSKSRYVLSTQLAWTGFKGNSLGEVLSYLRAAASADGTKPDGTVYICKNGNVRSTAREQFFAPLVRALKGLGRKVEILERGKDGQNGILPKGKNDVIGAVIGSAGVNWQSGGSRILPGAIVEHLTSFGAHFGTASQTKLTEFLRFGAAGSSGTVVEPLAIHTKFPNPMIHAFYAEGCSLAEAFYQSIGGPYQLMIVGDGLCRPFADFVPVHIDAPAAPWSGEVEIEAKGRGDRFELFVDGRLLGRGRTVKLDTDALDDGWHDVRFVSIAGDRIETRSYARLDAYVRKGRADLGFSVGSKVVEAGRPIVLRCSGARLLQLFDGDRLVGEAKGSKLEVPSAGLGPGRVTLLPRATFSGEAVVRGAPIEVEVRPEEIEAAPGGDDPMLPGLRGRAKIGGKWSPVALSYLGDRFRGKRLRDRKELSSAQEIELAGQIEVREAGLYQLTMSGTGTVTLTLGGVELAKDLAIGQPRYLPVRLGKGWHDVALRIVPEGRPDLSFLLGGETVLAPASFRHRHREEIEAEVEVKGVKPGEPIAVPADGLEVTFDHTVRGLEAIVLRPGPGVKSFPVRWTVEVSRSGRSRAATPIEAETLVCEGARDVPEFVELSFRKTRAKSIRIRPLGIDAGTEVLLADIIPLSKELR